MTTAEQTLRVIHAWYDAASRGEWQRVPEIAGPEYIRHEPTGTRIVTGEEYAAEIREQVSARGVLRWEYDAFAEGDIAFVILVMRGAPRGDASTVQAFRVAEGRLVETWYSAMAPVAWPLRPAAGGGDPEAGKEILRRWYEEMYAERRFGELAPQLCGPVFTRHEANGTFEVTAEEHAARLAGAYDGRPPTPVWPYRVFARDDKVGVISQSEQSGYVQAWRVENGKFVESWWPGFARAPW